MDKVLKLKEITELSDKKPMATNFDRVKAFMLMFNQEVKENPDWPDAEKMELRVDLIEEELERTKS